MLPNVKQSKKENIAGNILVEDYLRATLSKLLLTSGKTLNSNYKPWKSNMVPKYNQSLFGDFPKDLMKI